MAAAALAQPSTVKADPRLIVPLDVPSVNEARATIAALGDTVSFLQGRPRASSPAVRA